MTSLETGQLMQMRSAILTQNAALQRGAGSPVAANAPAATAAALIGWIKPLLSWQKAGAKLPSDWGGHIGCLNAAARAGIAQM